MEWCACDTFWLAGTAGRGGTIGPGKLPRRGDLGDVKYILQEVCTLAPFGYPASSCCMVMPSKITMSRPLVLYDYVDYSLLYLQEHPLYVRP